MISFELFPSRTVSLYRGKMFLIRTFAVLAMFIIAAVLTPGPDVASQMLLVTPLLVLYVASIGIAYFFGKKRDEEAAPDDAAEE